LAASLQRLGEFARARKLFSRAAELYAVAGDAVHEAIARDGLGVAELHLGRLECAAAEMELVRGTWQRLGNGGALARTLNNLGLVQHYLGDYAAAREHFAQAARLAQEAGLPGIEACAWLSLGDVERDCDALARAQEAYERGSRLAAGNQSPYLTRYSVDALGQVHRLCGKVDRAEALARQALEGARAAGSRFEEPLYLRSLALVYLDRREYRSAQAALDAALGVVDATRARRELAQVRLGRAQVAFAARRRRDALGELAALSDVLAELGYHGFLLADARRAQAVAIGSPRASACASASAAVVAASSRRSRST
jgi:tetratricopeptide (TPR) repeat protein